MRLKANRLLRYFPLLLIFIFIQFSATGCASSKKNLAHTKVTQSLCDLSHLGKNKYFYSKYYQRKLARSVRKLAN